MGARRELLFLWSTTLTFAIGIVLLLGFSVFVNPWGYFGPVGYHPYENAHLTKTRHLDALAPGQLPRVYVLGSSNVMRYSPETILRLTGQSAFNYGVFWGRAEDFYVLARHLIEERGHRPSLFIVGLEVWSFRPPDNVGNPVFDGMSQRLVNTPELARHLDGYHPLKRFWAAVTDSLTTQQLRTGLASMRRTTRAPWPTSLPAGNFDRHGMLTYYRDLYGTQEDIFARAEAGTFPVTERLRNRVRVNPRRPFEQLDQYLFETFWDTRVTYFERFLRLADDHGAEVAIVLTPVHPVFRQYLVEHTDYLPLLLRLRALLGEMEQRHPSMRAVVDMSQVENFAGDPEGFFDEAHLTTRNADLILERVLDGIGRVR